MSHLSHSRMFAPLLSATLLAAGFTPVASAAEPAASAKARPATAAKATPKPGGLIAALPHVMVHKSPTCGCCMVWVKHLEAAGFSVKTQDSNDMGAIKSRLGVPADKGSCHTAVVGGYFIEATCPPPTSSACSPRSPTRRG
jgi:hypothetical protein